MVASKNKDTVNNWNVSNVSNNRDASNTPAISETLATAGTSTTEKFKKDNSCNSKEEDGRIDPNNRSDDSRSQEQGQLPQQRPWNIIRPGGCRLELYYPVFF